MSKIRANTIKNIIDLKYRYFGRNLIEKFYSEIDRYNQPYADKEKNNGTQRTYLGPYLGNNLWVPARNLSVVQEPN